MSILAQTAVFTYEATKAAKGHDRFATHGTYNYNTSRLAKSGRTDVFRYGNKALYTHTGIGASFTDPNIIITDITQSAITVVGLQPEVDLGRTQVLRYGTKGSYIYSGKAAAIRGIDNRYRTATPAEYNYTNTNAEFNANNIVITGITQGAISIVGLQPDINTYIVRSATNVVYNYTSVDADLIPVPGGSVIVNSVTQGAITITGLQPDVIAEMHIYGIPDAAKASYNYTGIDAELANIDPNVIITNVNQGTINIVGQTPTVVGPLNWDIYRLNPPLYNAEYPPGSTNFSTQVIGLIDAVEALDTEVEEARENENSLVENLELNYMHYTLEKNIISEPVDGFRFTNMPNAVSAQDYVTRSQAQTALSVPSLDNYNTADLVGVPPFFANDLYKVSSDGLLVKTFVQGYGNVAYISTNPITFPRYNCSYLINYTTETVNNIYITSASPVSGDELKLLLINYTDTTNKIITAASNIRGESQFIIDPTIYNGTGAFSYVHLIYVGGTTGWFVKNFIQRSA